MSKIYLTGDMHASYDIDKLTAKNWKYGNTFLTKDDYLIILGDFGLVWDAEESKSEKYWLDWLEKKPWTTLFIDGNHENYDRLKTYPVSEWNGGKVQYIRPSVIHLMRGQYFTIDGTTFFTMGGASSHHIRDGVLEVGDPRIKEWSKDMYKLFRVNHVSWWKEELPSMEEYDEAIKNILIHDKKVDYVLTHCASTTEAAMWRIHEKDELMVFLTDLLASITYKRHYMGHYHTNEAMTSNAIVLYDKIERIQ